jgi:hypothetical protein
MRLEEPIDQAHRLSLWLIEQIRRDVNARKHEAAQWEPAPLPEQQT